MKELIFKNWSIITIKGIIAVIFGLVAILLSEGAVVYAIKTFGAILLISGLLMFGLTLLVKNKKDQICSIMEGGIDILMGILIISGPNITSTYFLALIMIWISIMGLLQIYDGYRIRNLLNHWWILMFNGFLAVLFAVLVFSQSFNSGLTLAILIGLQALVLGSFLIISSIKLKQLVDEIRIEIPSKEGDEGNQELSFY